MIKNKNFILTVILPIFISIIIGIVIIVLNSRSILNTHAIATVSNEKRIMRNEMTELNAEKKDLNYEIAEYDKTLEENRLLVEEVAALNAELTSYETSIETAKTTITELDTSIESKTAHFNSLSSVSETTAGTTVSYKNKKLNIPTDLKAGRYKAEGTGTLMIYTIAGTLQDKKDLSVMDTHSYTFDIASGQSLKIDGSLSLTEIIE